VAKSPAAQGNQVDLIAVLRGKTWEELEAIEHAERVMFPDSIRFRDRSGAVREIPVMVRVLRADERRKARVEARKYAADNGLDADRDQDLCVAIDRLHQLARAIRDAKAPHDQHATVGMLESGYDTSSLDELWERYEVYADRQDPRMEITDEAQFWAALGVVAKVGNVLPLAGLVPHSQFNCIVFGARQALLSPTFKSFSESIDSSTPAS